MVGRTQPCSAAGRSKLRQCGQAALKLWAARAGEARFGGAIGFGVFRQERARRRDRLGVLARIWLGCCVSRRERTVSLGRCRERQCLAVTRPGGRLNAVPASGNPRSRVGRGRGRSAGSACLCTFRVREARPCRRVEGGSRLVLRCGSAGRDRSPDCPERTGKSRLDTAPRRAKGQGCDVARAGSGRSGGSRERQFLVKFQNGECSGTGPAAPPLRLPAGGIAWGQRGAGKRAVRPYRRYHRWSEVWPTGSPPDGAVRTGRIAGTARPKEMSCGRVAASCCPRQCQQDRDKYGLRCAS